VYKDAPAEFRDHGRIRLEHRPEGTCLGTADLSIHTKVSQLLHNTVLQCVACGWYPETPSTASMAGNMTRCALSAIALAVLEPARKAVGYGWVMSFLGLVTGIGGFGAQCVVRKWGMRWRNERQEKGRHRDMEKASHGEEGHAAELGSRQVPASEPATEKRPAEHPPGSAST
jgi:hypothetical protein